LHPRDNRSGYGLLLSLHLAEDFHVHEVDVQNVVLGPDGGQDRPAKIVAGSFPSLLGLRDVTIHEAAWIAAGLRPSQ
jgi:hypothetical protein